MIPPIILIIFNRIDLIKKQIKVLRKLPLSHLFVVADGPRPGKNETDKCIKVREKIDSCHWQCQVSKNYADTNMGCAQRIVSGIDWAFSQVDRAIILEDDCLPDPPMFRFCGELLERYKNDNKIMHICGTQPFVSYKTSNSYLFSNQVSCWGWATWSRAWNCMDIQMRISYKEQQRLLEKYLFNNSRTVSYVNKVLEMTRRKELDAWDYPWQLSIWRNDGIAIFPKLNLVKNIGFREDATHTKDKNCKWANIPTKEICFPLSHPAYVTIDQNFDRKFVNEVFGNESYMNSSKNIIRIIKDAVKKYL